MSSPTGSSASASMSISSLTKSVAAAYRHGASAMERKSAKGAERKFQISFLDGEILKLTLSNTARVYTNSVTGASDFHEGTLVLTNYRILFCESRSYAMCIISHTHLLYTSTDDHDALCNSAASTEITLGVIERLERSQLKIRGGGGTLKRADPKSPRNGGDANMLTFSQPQAAFIVVCSSL
jgi:hypothetical protein